MKRIVKIEGVGNVGFPDAMNDAEVSQAAGRLYDANSLANVLQPTPPTPSMPLPKVTRGAAATAGTEGWRHIQTSDGARHLIHPEDLPEAQRRDPKLQILDNQQQ